MSPFFGVRIFSMLINSMLDERTNSHLTWFNSPLCGNQKAETLVDMIQIGQCEAASAQSALSFEIDPDINISALALLDLVSVDPPAASSPESTGPASLNNSIKNIFANVAVPPPLMPPVSVASPLLPQSKPTTKTKKGDGISLKLALANSPKVLQILFGFQLVPAGFMLIGLFTVKPSSPRCGVSPPTCLTGLTSRTNMHVHWWNDTGYPVYPTPFPRLPFAPTILRLVLHPHLSPAFFFPLPFFLFLTHPLFPRNPPATSPHAHTLRRCPRQPRVSPLPAPHAQHHKLTGIESLGIGTSLTDEKPLSALLKAYNTYSKELKGKQRPAVDKIQKRTQEILK
ncbi:hypothetical protein DFH08DRAFT_940436 [Mycena albidolilacea]|uniref:Uncharacterized protein n=1 Tax=Mycena albidolilacea TaxID=1033008 RepID=A0AAD7EJG7_9AGAR|nr:hypothetical protein DFH08DRAFT_940436 [Mycena albidolilacea]